MNDFCINLLNVNFYINIEKMSLSKKITNDKITLITHGKEIITVKITLRCKNCEYKRIFTNKFTPDNIELILVTLKILNWLTCDSCNTEIKNEVEFVL